MGKVSRRRFMSGCAFAALATVIPWSPAFAFQSSNNIVADFTYAINRNRGVTQAVAKELAMAVGASSAGTSLWSRIIKRSPLRRLFWIANLAGAAYAIYQIISDSYAPTGATSYDTTGWTTIGEMLSIAGVKITANSMAEYDAVGPALAAAGRDIADVTINFPGFGTIGTHICVISRTVNRIDSIGGHFEVRDVVGGAISTNRLYDPANPSAPGNAALVPQPSDVIVGPKRFYRGYFFLQGLPNTKQFRWINDMYPATHPEDIPSNADLIADTIAEDVNENYQKAKAANPALAAMAPVTAAEIAAVAPAGSTARKKSTATATDPMPGVIIDTDPDGSPSTPTPPPSTPGDGGSSGGSGPDWTTPPIGVPIPDDHGIPPMPTPGAIDDRLGVNACPPLPSGLMTHCAPLNSARPYLIAASRLAGTVATFMIILKD